MNEAVETPLGLGDRVIAIDVGGTHARAAMIDECGRLLEVVRVGSRVSDDGTAAALIDQLSEIVAGLHERFSAAPPARVGLSVPGIVDEARGIGVMSSNLGWRNAPIRDLAAQAFNMPVAFGHDVRAACLAELRLGAARGVNDAVVITLGTGMSGAIISDGEIRPAAGFAGEFGHSVFDPEGEPCYCGSRGCAEPLVSAAGIARQYFAATGNQVRGSLEVLQLAQQGDANAVAVWARATEVLGVTLARIAAFLGPERIVLGGGLSRAGSALLDPVREVLEAHLSFHRVPELVAATLSDDAGLLGTALLAREATP